jgi:KDO2-lipid IV(A) lauroyltransferase
MTSEAGKKLKQRHPMETTSSFRHVLSTPAFYRIGFAVANRVPKGFLYLIADLIGEASFFRYKARGENVRRNLEGVFPGIAEQEATSLVRRVFRNYARHLVDYGRFKEMSPESLDRAIREIEGIQNIETALRSQKGQILVSGHLGNWELGALYFARIGRKVNIVMLPDDASQVDAIRES